MCGLNGATLPLMVRAAAAAQWLATAAMLGACVPASLERGGAVVTPAAVLAAFEVTGRLSMHHGSDAVAASFSWSRRGERDELKLATPFGQTVASLSGDSSQVRLQAADGRVWTASDWTALTEEGLGWPLPLRGLAFWIQAASRPDAAFSVETGDDGRPAVLRQDGWTIVYQAYVPTAAGVWRPSRLTLSYPDFELRIAIDGWQ